MDLARGPAAGGGHAVGRAWRRRRRVRRCRTCCRGRTPSSICSGCCRSSTRCRAATTRGCVRRCRIAGISRRERRSCRCFDEALAIDDPDVLGSFLSGAGPSIAMLARRERRACRAELAALYERRQRAGHDPDAAACIRGRSHWRTPGRPPTGERMRFVAGLTCHLCGATYPAEALWVCELPRSARSHLRLRRDPEGDQPGG